MFEMLQGSQGKCGGVVEAKLEGVWANFASKRPGCTMLGWGRPGIYHHDCESVAASLAANAWAAAERVFSLLGWRVVDKPTKRRPFAAEFEALGVKFNLTDLPTGTLSVGITPKRAAAVAAERRADPKRRHSAAGRGAAAARAIHQAVPVLPGQRAVSSLLLLVIGARART